MVVVVRDGQVVMREAYGEAEVAPKREPMAVDAVFDLASLTKPLATAIAVMQLVEGGRVGLDAPAARYLPELAEAGKGDVTVRELMLHTSGLPADTALADFRGERDEATRRVLAAKLEARPGARVRYSDVGFLTLGAL
ncbi:MAG TPA: serine hydrolase domain-containing protein, partial [Minicystis sp.]|nr:serine hydrolase domain-containing protein [Minicystis sp.]